MTKTRNISDLGAFTPSGAGGVQRTVENKLRDVVSVKDFGAAGDGVADDTAAIQAAVDHCASTNKTLWIGDGTFLISTFGNTLTDGTSCAIKIASSVSINGTGVIQSNTTTVTRSIFGLDSTSDTIEFSLKSLKFSGASRYRALNVASGSSLSILEVDGITTERQSIVTLAAVSKALLVTNNLLGATVISATNVSPTMNVQIPESASGSQKFLVANNTVRTGTEVITTGAFVIHGVPVGGEVIGNSHYNLGAVLNEGYDIDNVGSFAKICRNLAWKSGFEYKTGTDGYSNSRDIIFSENISYASVSTGITLQSSCIGFGNVVYNPANWGLFMTPANDIDGVLINSHLNIDGFRIVYAGAAWNGAFRLSTGSTAGYKSITLSNIRIELDPAWDAANPSTPIPGLGFDIDGNVSNFTLSNAYLDRMAADGINVRPVTAATNLKFQNIHFGGAAGDSCFDLDKCQDVQILNPIFPSSITDRPVRLSSCTRVRIDCEFHTSIGLAITSGSNTGVLINNWSSEAAGIGNPPSASNIWPLGCIVRNSDDSTVWLRFSTSTLPANAWVQIA
jgi:hypothetical protein